MLTNVLQTFDSFRDDQAELRFTPFDHSLVYLSEQRIFLSTEEEGLATNMITSKSNFPRAERRCRRVTVQTTDVIPMPF